MLSRYLMIVLVVSPRLLQPWKTWTCRQLSSTSTLFMASDQLMICVAPELLDRKHSGQNPGGKRATSQEQSHSLLGLYKL